MRRCRNSGTMMGASEYHALYGMDHQDKNGRAACMICKKPVKVRKHPGSSHIYIIPTHNEASR